MKIIKRTSRIVEHLVILAEPGDPGLIKLIDSDHPEYEGWTLDWHKGNKFVLKREGDYTVLVGSKNGGKGREGSNWSPHGS